MAGMVYEARKLIKSTVVSVKITSELRVRAWIAVHLIKLAVAILGATFEFEMDEPECTQNLSNGLSNCTQEGD